MVSRRALVAGGAGALVLGALGYRGVERGVFSSGQGAAYDAWRTWSGYSGEGAVRPLRAAILASSAHNTQPWMFEPQGDAITVYADLRRSLGAADPYRRELFFSIGCALENLYLAAFAKGFNAVTEIVARTPLAPDATGLFKIAEVTLEPVEKTFGSARGEPFDTLRRLYAQIPHRHTNRGAYLPDKSLPPDLKLSRRNVEPPLPVIAAVTDKAARGELGALIVEATARFIADPEMSRDSGRWMRTGRAEIARSRDGVTVDTAGLSPAITALAKLLPDQSAAEADQYWLQSTKDVQVPTAAAYLVYVVHDRLNIWEQIDAGRHWQRQHLMLTEAGVAAQPMNAPIEMMDRDRRQGRKNAYANALLNMAGLAAGTIVADPIFIARIGYAVRPAGLSPRRRLGDMVRRKGFA